MISLQSRVKLRTVPLPTLVWFSSEVSITGRWVLWLASNFPHRVMLKIALEFSQPSCEEEVAVAGCSMTFHALTLQLRP
jgi:hypothetical protein